MSNQTIGLFKRLMVWFPAPEAYHSFRPGYLPREEISSLRVEKKPEVLTTEDIKRNSSSKPLRRQEQTMRKDLF